MAEISIRREHSFEDPIDLRSRIEGLAEKVSDKLGGTWEWEGDVAVCRARGAEARVSYDESRVLVEISLPLMLRPLRGAIESRINESYEHYFGRA